MRALAVVALLLGLAAVDRAEACTCQAPPAHLRSKAELDAWRIQQAATVVRGRVIEVRAGATVLHGVPYASARFETTQVIKGDVRAGQAQIRTPEQSAMCGIREFLSSAASSGRDVVLELARDAEGHYMANSCRLYSSASAMNQELLSGKRN